MPVFRIVDMRASTIVPEAQIEAESPEAAAQQALGMKVFRGGVTRNLVCRVYWQSRDNLNMVRLYGEAHAAELEASEV